VGCTKNKDGACPDSNTDPQIESPATFSTELLSKEISTEKILKSDAETIEPKVDRDELFCDVCNYTFSSKKVGTFSSTSVFVIIMLEIPWEILYNKLKSLPIVAISPISAN